MEKTQKSEVKTPQKLTEEAAEKKERLERLDPMTTSQIEHENTQMINDLYRLLKKYQGLRNLIRELKVSLITNSCADERDDIYAFKSRACFISAGLMKINFLFRFDWYSTGGI